MRARHLIVFALGFDLLLLFSQISSLSLSHSEASILYGEFSFLQQLIHISFMLFGVNDIGLRFVMVLFHLLSVVLLFAISSRYLRLYSDRFWLLLIYILLPGVMSAAILVNSAGLIIFGLLLYIYLTQKVSQKYLNVLLLFYALINVGFAYLFLGLALYFISQKKPALVVYNFLLYFLSSYIYGFDAQGYPSGHFLDTIGVYSAIFTPIIFIYLSYVLYRRYLTGELDILWYISAVPLLFSLLLSFRQAIPVEHFAPYLIVALPLSAQTFLHSYRIRLKEFRGFYRSAFTLSFAFLLINAFIVIFHKELYIFLDDPQKHFAYDMHIAKELSSELKSQGIECVETDEKMQLRLRYFGINRCSKNRLQRVEDWNGEPTDVTISYKNKSIYRANVTKINTKSNEFTDTERK